MATKRPRDATPELGQRFEAENEEADLQRWRAASDADRGRAIAELMAYAEKVAAATGHRNDDPAPVLPRPRGGPGDGA